MSMGTWAEDILDRVAALKLTRCTFDRAWTIAELEYPAPAPLVAWVEPDELGQSSLFDSVDKLSDVESLRDFVRRTARAAWEGEQVAPASWRPEVLRTV